MVCLILQALGQIPKTLNCQDQEVVVLGFHTRQVSQPLIPITFLCLGRQGKNSSVIISHVRDPWQLCVWWHIFLFVPACWYRLSSIDSLSVRAEKIFRSHVDLFPYLTEKDTENRREMTGEKACS